MDPGNPAPFEGQHGQGETLEQSMRRHEAESRLQRAEVEAKKAALSRRVAFAAAVGVIVLTLFTYAMWRRRQAAEARRAYERMGESWR